MAIPSIDSHNFTFYFALFTFILLNECWSSDLTPSLRLNFISFRIYFAGYAYDPDCMYINGSGRDYYEFYIQLNRCGTLGKNSLNEDSRKNPTVRFI